MESGNKTKRRRLAALFIGTAILGAAVDRASASCPYDDPSQNGYWQCTYSGGTVGTVGNQGGTTCSTRKVFVNGYYRTISERTLDNPCRIERTLLYMAVYQIQTWCGNTLTYAYTTEEPGGTITRTDYCY